MTSPTQHRLLRWLPGLPGLPEIAVLVTWSLTVVGTVWAASAERAEVLNELRAQRSVSVDHEARLRALEKQASEVAADVRWIRQTLEQQRKP